MTSLHCACTAFMISDLSVHAYIYIETCSCLHYFLYTVPGQSVSVEFGTTKPSCIKDTLILICRINSSLADFIEWNITVISNTFRFSTERHSVGDVMMNSNSQIIAKLTDNDTMLASNLTISSPLNNITYYAMNNVTYYTLNNTIIRCSVGNSNESNTTSVDTRIILEGEELKIYLITIFFISILRMLLILNSYRNIFPLSIVQVYLHLLPT